MSRSNRKHESPAAKAKKGPKPKPDPDAPKARLKSHRQTRVNERIALRKEWR